MRLKFDERINNWIEVDENSEYDLYLEEFLKKKMDNIKYLQYKNWDCLFIICGAEGSGKSTLSFIFGQYLTNLSLTLDNIANGSDDAMEKLKYLPDGSVLILDEAELLFSSRDTMTKEQRQLTKILMIIRQKRMVLILVTPDFFGLSRYIAVNRARFMIRTYTDVTLDRGRYGYWGTKKKARLYQEGKKNFGQYTRPKAQIYGRFLDYKLPFDEKYQKIKFETLMKAFEKKEDKKKKKEIEETDRIIFADS